MSQRYDEIFLSKLNPKALIFISCPNKLIDVEDRVILSHDNKGGLNTCLSISQVETPYERSTFIFSEMIGGLCMFVLVLSLFLVRKMNLSTDYNPREILKQMRIKNGTKIIISHLNINSIRNKFDCLTYLIDKNVDIFLISESKLDSTFPDSQFFIHGFHSPYRRDRNDKGGGGGYYSMCMIAFHLEK